MSKSPAEKQRDYRARQAAKIAPAKTAGKRITHLLVDHPEKLAKFDAFMIQMNRELTESRRQSHRLIEHTASGLNVLISLIEEEV